MNRVSTGFRKPFSSHLQILGTRTVDMKQVLCWGPTIRSGPWTWLTWRFLLGACELIRTLYVRKELQWLSWKCYIVPYIIYSHGRPGALDLWTPGIERAKIPMNSHYQAVTFIACVGTVSLVIYEGRPISNAHSEISRKREHVFKQTKVGSKVQYFIYKLTYFST